MYYLTRQDQCNDTLPTVLAAFDTLADAEAAYDLAFEDDGNEGCWLQIAQTVIRRLRLPR
jgi:hypothetical protein